MKTTRLLALSCGLVAALFLSGCDAGTALFTEQPPAPTVVQVDSVQLPDGSLIAVTPEIRDLVNPAKIIRAGTSVAAPAGTPGEVVPSAMAQAAVGAVRMLPIPYADVIGLGLSGALAIAAGWLNKRKTTSERTAQAVVQGVDTFRDILDQTAVGAALDRRLTDALAARQRELGVADSVAALLARYRTPDKPSHVELNNELLAALRDAGALKG